MYINFLRVYESFNYFNKCAALLTDCMFYSGADASKFLWCLRIFTMLVGKTHTLAAISVSSVSEVTNKKKQ